VGWYIYVYVSRGDWIYLAGLGAAMATSVLCGWLTPTVGPAIACAAAAFIVTTFIVVLTAPKAGYCREFRIGYADWKDVRRSC
jgi:hypothetical protein